MTNQQQAPLFHEDFNAALGYLISALGGNKKVGYAMWPSMSPDRAGRKVADCLNENHPQKFGPDDILWLLAEGRKAGIHSAMAYLNTECGYDIPRPVEPEDEAASLMRTFCAAKEEMNQILQRMERLNLPVHPNDRRAYPQDRRSHLGAV